jgi:2',3'-cyclic-nucleotide 2'-phosphodiesterase/3'-nucleotidase
VKAAIAKLRREVRPDLIVVAAHSGLGRNLQTQQDEEPSENVVYQLAQQVQDIDAIAFGHSHLRLEGAQIGKVLVVQPKNAGASLARIDFTFDGKLISKQSHLIPVTADTTPAADLVAMAVPYEAATQRYLNTPVATASRELLATRGREHDTAIVDAIQRVQLYFAKADVSFTALFDPQVRMAPGEVTVRQIAALYPYENELFAIEGTGKMVKDALENAARYYSDKSMPGFNYDMDRSRPEGDRIRNLRWKGRPLDPAQKLRIAINNYRAGGTGGYEMYRGAKILWRSGEEIRDLVIRYYTERKVIPSEPTNNWKLIN